MVSITIGRIVGFYPNNDKHGLIPSNGMETTSTTDPSPAMVTWVLKDRINLNVFTSDPINDPVKQAWNIVHKSALPKDANGVLITGISYWDWLPRV